MERKLIKQGLGGLTVYLPKKWLDKKKLKEGDVVNIIEKDVSLLIEGKVAKNQQLMIAINAKNEKDLSPLLTHAYRKGFDKMVLSSTSKIQKKTIKKIVERLLLGFEVTSFSDKKITVENISEPNEEKYEVMLKKVFLIIKETQEAMKGPVKERNMEEIQELREQADKFILFCKRLQIKEKYTKNILFEWENLTFLMHIQHTYYYLYKYLLENNLKLEDPTITLLEKLEDYFDLYQKAYCEKNKDFIHEINLLKNKYHFGDLVKTIEKSRGKNNMVLCYIREIFRLIQIGTSPALSMTLEKLDSLKI